MPILKHLPAALLLVVLLLFPTGARAAGIPLGIVIEDTPQGILVREVQPGGIADRCMPRLRAGSYIATLNGFPVPSAVEFKRAIECSDFVRFEFSDAKGELRWARAWSRGNAPADAACCCTIASTPPLAGIPAAPVVPKPLPPLPPPPQP
jgi:hypothetical protein